MLNLNLKNLLKYLLEGLAVAAAAYYIPRRTSNLRDIAMIAATAAAVFAILDMFTPAVSHGARQGAGFGIGYNITTEGFDDQESESSSSSSSSSGSDSGSDSECQVQPNGTMDNYSSVL